MPADRDLIHALRAELRTRADPVKAPEMQRYMKSAMPFAGVQKPARAQIARAVFPQHPLAEFDDWHDTVLALWREATVREERYLAIDLAQARAARPHRTISALPIYEELIVSGAWWDYVDAVAAGLLGELLDRDGDALPPVLLAWAHDDDVWKRRAAIVAQVRRGPRVDGELLFACIEPNRDEPEFFLRKAIGWALRSYAKVDPDAVVAYCAAHELSPLSRREALRNVVVDPA